MKICGLIVLRKPIFNYDEEGRGAFLPHAPHIGGRHYAGIDRMPWFDLDEDYYTGTLPDEFVRLRQELLNNNQDLSDIKLMTNMNKAFRLLDYSNRNKVINELVAVYSDRMTKGKGLITYPIDIDWLGVDIYCHGYGSLIREGIFVKPSLFPDYLSELNRNGLFDLDSGLIDSYIDTYTKLALDNNLEPVDEPRERLDTIALGRVRAT